MLGHRHHKAGPALPEEFRPGFGVKLFSLKQGDKVLVAKLVVRAIGVPVMLIDGFGGFVHLVGIPLVMEGRHRVYAPVNEDAEAALLIPGGHPVVAQGVVVRRKGPLSDDAVDGLEVVLFPSLGLGGKIVLFYGMNVLHGFLLLIRHNAFFEDDVGIQGRF